MFSIILVVPKIAMKAKHHQRDYIRGESKHVLKIVTKNSKMQSQKNYILHFTSQIMGQSHFSIHSAEVLQIQHKILYSPLIKCVKVMTQTWMKLPPLSNSWEETKVLKLNCFSGAISKIWKAKFRLPWCFIWTVSSKRGLVL